MAALRQWNERCLPPWSDRDLQAKVAHALRYGREPVGRLLSTTSQAAPQLRIPETHGTVGPAPAVDTRFVTCPVTTLGAESWSEARPILIPRPTIG